MPSHRYMEENGLATILATKRSAGVTPEVNLCEPSHVCLCQVQIRLLTLALKPRGDITRSPKQWYQWPHKKRTFYVLQYWSFEEKTFVKESLGTVLEILTKILCFTLKRSMLWRGKA